jgi:hypothetical protein
VVHTDKILIDVNGLYERIYPCNPDSRNDRFWNVGLRRSRNVEMRRPVRDDDCHIAASLDGSGELFRPPVNDMRESALPPTAELHSHRGKCSKGPILL